MPAPDMESPDEANQERGRRAFDQELVEIKPPFDVIGGGGGEAGRDRVLIVGQGERDQGLWQ